MQYKYFRCLFYLGFVPKEQKEKTRKLSTIFKIMQSERLNI